MSTCVSHTSLGVDSGVGCGLVTSRQREATVATSGPILGFPARDRRGVPSSRSVSVVVGPIEPTMVWSLKAVRSGVSRPISAATSSRWTTCWAEVNNTAPTLPAVISSMA